MGAALVAPLATVDRGQSDVINEAVAAEPKDVQPAMWSLLDLDLHGLCEAYRRLAEQGGSTVVAADLEKVLGLPSKASKVILAGRSSLQTLEILALLAVLSHTHAAAKARFLHGIADRTATGRLNFQEFRSVAIALLRATCFLAQLPRGRWPKAATVDVLMSPLFERYAPDIPRDSFVSLLMSIGPLARMLHRFARGAVDQNFRLASGRGGGDNQGHQRRHFASVLPQRGIKTQPSMVGRINWKTGPASLYKVPPRRPITADVVCSTPRELESNGGSMPESEASPTKTHSPKSTITVSPPRKPQTGLPGSPSRRRGYFQAVQSKYEIALVEKLESLQHEKLEVSKKRDVGLDSNIYMQEQQIREEIRGELSNQERRSRYRKCVDDMRNGVLSPPPGIGVLPPGCFWTASQEHVACGGVLPHQCSRPLTPTDVQQSIQNKAQEAAHHQANSKHSTQTSQQLGTTMNTINLTLDELLSRACGAPAGGRLTSAVLGLRPQHDSDDEDSNSSFTEDHVSTGSQHHHNNRHHHRGVARANAEDVLIAFELYRNYYWRHDVHNKSHGNRRDEDIDTILAETVQEPTTWKDCIPSQKTLHSFFQTIWPGLTTNDFKSMLKTIEHSKRPDLREALVHKENPRRQAETLRELIELFDAIDKKASGAVPLEAVERFLCGELLTARESDRLIKERQQFGSALVGTPAGCEAYIDHINENSRHWFMSTQVEDRDDWLVTVPEHERRWVGLQACFKGKEPGQNEDEEQPTAARTKSSALYKIIGQRMEKLARFINKEDKEGVGSLPVTGSSIEDSASGTHGQIPCGDLEVACKPGLIPQYLKDGSEGAGDGSANLGQEGRARLRLVRLYWRYLLGSAVQQQLRDNSEQSSFLNLRSNGQIDLVGFICILAHDQLRGLFPKGVTPTAKVIRETAYAK